jgi:DnaJ-class molecular chaperone
MKPCQNCQTVIDEYLLDKQLEPLRELTADDCNICADYATIVADACVKCGGAVYVPRNEPVSPDYCPACRSDLIESTGHDPGWTRDPVST